MAFGNNYAYNPYINPYASPYNPQPQPMMQNFQQQQQAIPQIQQQTPQNGFVWVDGIEEANNFLSRPTTPFSFGTKTALASIKSLQMLPVNLPCKFSTWWNAKMKHILKPILRPI